MSLDSFQREVLHAFFAKERRFFLTGGAALAGFYLGHRTTKDLDLFTTENHLDDGVAMLHQVADQLGASIEAQQTAPEFRRFVLTRGDSGVVVDLVYDRAPQVIARKRDLDGISVDPPEEILANKLCTLLSRSEIRDLVDVRALEQAGYAVESSLPLAQQKDGGMTPSQLAWILSEIEIGDDARIPGGLSPAELREYLRDLQHRLTAASFPT